MRIRKLNSVDVKLHDLTKVKLKTAGNTSVVQFTTGNNKTCTVRNLSKDTYLDVKTGEVRKKKKSESRYQSPKSVRKSNNRLMDLIRCNTTDFYDGFGRLEQVTKADGSFQKNHYDAEGLRAEMEENGQLVKFLYNEDREAVAEEESDGNVIRYIRGLGLISSDSEKAKTYYHYVSDEQGSITHVINGEEKESGELPQEDVQSRVLNHYEYDAFGNAIRCEEQVHNRFRYTGEQYDPLTGQYYLRARYYNPVIARFTQEDTYYGDGLNLYTYCQNNPILYHDPTGHGTKENSPYSRKEQQYIDAGADPDTARLAAECYPDANSKKSLYDKYKKQGYNAQDAKKLANYEIVHGEERAKNYAANNVKKSGPDYTATSPRDNVNTDWRTQERLNAQRNASNSPLLPMNLQFFAAKRDESGNKTNYGKSSDKINWEAVVSKKTGETRVEHVKLHESNDLSKLSHGVFYGNSQNTINNAWKNKSNGIKISEGNTDMYIIPYENAGYSGGFGGQGNNLNTVTIITQKGTNNIITGFPGNGYRYALNGLIGGN